LNEEDFKVLVAIEHGMARHEYVPLEYIAKVTNFTDDKLDMILRKLHRLGLIQRNKGPYIGYVLTTFGYDSLALRALVKRGVLERISADPIGVGKEADIYEGVTPSGEVVAVKFHRIGRVSFRNPRRVRTYVGDRRHISWLYMSRLSAQREYEALVLVHQHGVKAPRPIAHNRHVVVTEKIEGVPLFEVPPLEDPEDVMYQVIENVKLAYTRAGVVHGDLSEFNVLVTVENGREVPVIIDWPQWVPSIHPSAESLLRRDIENIVRFFRRKYNLRVDVEEIIKQVTQG